MAVKYTMVADINQTKSLMLASSDNVKLDWWRKGLHGFINLHEVNDLNQLKGEISQFKPEMLLIDYELVGADMVSEVCSLKRLYPEIKMVVLTKSHSKEEEWSLLRAGVRGCCQWDVEPSTQKTLIKAIQQGELWARRSLIHKLLEQLQLQANRNNKIDPNCLSHLENLTEREYEIAIRVANGESNKDIAQSLNISDRTVKAHISEIFRKLGVTDRVKVAVILSAEKRSVRRTSQKANNKTKTTN